MPYKKSLRSSKRCKSGQRSVKGYRRSNGTYVKSHCVSRSFQRKQSRKGSKKSSKKMSKKSSKKSSKKMSKKMSSVRTKVGCNDLLKNKIRVNMKELKDGRFVSRQQAIAVSYSQVKKSSPYCKRYFKRSM